MDLKYDPASDFYTLKIHCNKPKFCKCNNKIVQLFNNNDSCEMKNFRVIGLAHIKYDKIKDKINKKVHTKYLFIWPSNDKEILDLNVLKVLFYPEDIELLDVNYNQKIEMGDVYFKNLSSLSFYFVHPKIITNLNCILPSIVKNCPNIECLDIDRAGDKGNESLEFIIDTLAKLKKNLVIKLHYINSCNYKVDDDRCIKEHKLEKLDKDTVQYKIPNIHEKIYVTVYTTCYP